MARYYDIAIVPQGQTVPLVEWTSHPDGNYDPNALNVEFDLLVYNFASPMGASTISVEGIDLSKIAQSVNYAGGIAGLGGPGGMNITVKGGMKKGLPLVDPSQAGTLLTGQIFQSFANWEGTDMVLDFVVLTAAGTQTNPVNLVLNWSKGMTLSTALQNMFNAAYPGLPIVLNISPNLVNDHDIPHFTSTLEQMSRKIESLTAGMLGESYVGVQIGPFNGGFLAFDNSTTVTPQPIHFKDFIGQPTWIGPYEMQIKLVLRADLWVGKWIKMPQGIQDAPGFVLTREASMPSYIKYTSIFQGAFWIKSIRHVGNFRASEGDAWITIVNCVPTGVPIVP